MSDCPVILTTIFLRNIYVLTSLWTTMQVALIVFSRYP